ncbi:MAG: helix-turn-helix domain-containing protein, partial [Woeseiaceae bacterium]
MNKDSEENDKNSNLGNEISCGELLARTRQEKDLNTKEIAKELRINVSIIEMMEGNEFQSIGAPVFVKGYLRQYANILGLSADSILEEYNQLNPDKNSLPIVNKAVEKISKYVLTPKLILVGVSFFLILLIISMIVSSLSQIETLPNQEAKIQDIPVYDSPSVMDETNATEMQEPLV